MATCIIIWTEEAGMEMLMNKLALVFCMIMAKRRHLRAKEKE